MYCNAIRHGEPEDWDFAWERYLKTTASSEKELLLNALGCAREPWIINRFLHRAITEDGIRRQDVFRAFSSVANSVYGQPVAFTFFRENFDLIRKKYEKN